MFFSSTRLVQAADHDFKVLWAWTAIPYDPYWSVGSARIVAPRCRDSAFSVEERRVIDRFMLLWSAVLEQLGIRYSLALAGPPH